MACTCPRGPGRRCSVRCAPRAQAGGFSLHAGVSIRPGQRAKLEWLFRYVSRAPLAQDRLALSVSGQVCYEFKTSWLDGTMHVVLDPLDFIARLAALVPRWSDRIDLTGSTAATNTLFSA